MLTAIGKRFRPLTDAIAAIMRGADPRAVEGKGPDRGSGLAPGDPHYRAYVGPPEDYDLIGGIQFALLFALGLRGTHRLADLGCGSLRAGRLLVPYLEPGGYFGVEPNRWLVDEAIEREIGRDLIERKRPRFLFADDFGLERFGVDFDFVLAQSIFSHTAPDLLATGLRSAAKVLSPGGLLVATFVEGDGPESAAGWRYPECVTYTWAQIAEAAERAGLSARRIDWPHPRQVWFLAARTDGAVDLDGLRPQLGSGSPATRASSSFNDFDRQLTEEDLRARRHRELVGGMWEEIGRVQFEFLKSRGLRPGDRLLDIGCGALRGGLHFIRYLEKGLYAGVDSNESLIRAARLELAEARLSDRAPVLAVEEDFRFERLGVRFPFAIAQSLFTHLPVNRIERCLANVAEVLEPGGRLFATYFPAPRRPAPPELTQPGGFVTFSDRDPYHYHPSTFELLVAGLPLEVRDVGPWGHPRSQYMLEFVRR